MSSFFLFFNRKLTHARTYFVLLLVFSLAVVLVLRLLKCDAGELLDHMYYYFGVNPTEAGTPVSQKIVFLVIALIGLFFFNGLLITAFANGIERYVENIRGGRIRYRWSDHMVMIGYNMLSGSVIEHALTHSKGSKLVILTSKDAHVIRTQLQASLPKNIEERVVIYAGESDISKHMKSLRLSHAQEVFIMVEGNEWENQYTQSMSILQEVAHAAGNRSIESGNLLKVNVLINDSIAYDLVQRLELPECLYSTELPRKRDDKNQEPKFQQNIDLHIFNFHDNWARLLWSYHGRKNKDASYVYDALDFEPLEGTDKYVHLVIAGFNSMGRALLLEALRICHYPNFNEQTGENRTQITIIDPRGDELETQWMSQYAHLSQITDVEIDFVCAAIESLAVRRQLEEWSADHRRLLTVAICVSDPDAAMGMALTLPEGMYYHYNELTLQPQKETAPLGKQNVTKNSTRPRILVRQAIKNLHSELLAANVIPYQNVKLFGSFTEGFDEVLLNDDLAICIHGVYCKYSSQLEQGQKGIEQLKEIPFKQLLEVWRKSWIDLKVTPETNRLSSRYQVDSYRSLLAMLNRIKSLPQAEQELMLHQLANAEHRRWIAERTLAGWRQAYANELRIDRLKIHTCIKPFTDLPEDETIKDINVVQTAEILVENLKK